MWATKQPRQTRDEVLRGLDLTTKRVNLWLNPLCSDNCYELCRYIQTAERHTAGLLRLLCGLTYHMSIYSRRNPCQKAFWSSTRRRKARTATQVMWLAALAHFDPS